MSDGQSNDGVELEGRLDDLSAQIAHGQADIDALRTRVDQTNGRVSAGEDATAEQGRKIENLEGRVNVDEEMIAELQADGLLSTRHAAQLEEALRSSRRIGAALGIVMANCKVSEEDAFALLRRASQHSNRKVRLLADEVVLTGDVSCLPKVK